VTASFYVGRNTIYVLVKDYPLWNKYGWRIIRGQLKIAGEALRAWRGAEARARLRGMFMGLLGVPRMLFKRRKVMASRRLTLPEIDALLTP
jgi:hypothetical protein